MITNKHKQTNGIMHSHIVQCVTHHLRPLFQTVSHSHNHMYTLQQCDMTKFGWLVG